MEGLPPRYRKPTAEEIAVVRRALEVGMPFQAGEHMIGPADPAEKKAVIERIMAQFATSDVTFNCTCGCPSISVKDWRNLKDSRCIAEAQGRSAYGPMHVILFGNDEQIAGVDINGFVVEQHELALPTSETIVGMNEKIDMRWVSPPPEWKQEPRTSA